MTRRSTWDVVDMICALAAKATWAIIMPTISPTRSTPSTSPATTLGSTRPPGSAVLTTWEGRKPSVLALATLLAATPEADHGIAHPAHGGIGGRGSTLRDARHHHGGNR